MLEKGGSMSVNHPNRLFDEVDATDFIKEVHIAGITKKEIVDLSNRYGLIKAGHFVLLSGLHTPNFIQFNLLAETLRLSNILASQFKRDNIDIVLTPDTSGIRLAGGIADACDADLIVAPVDDSSYPQNTSSDDYTKLKNKKVLISVDIITSGKGLVQLSSIVTNHGGIVAGIAAFINRGYKTIKQLQEETAVQNIKVICTGNFLHYDTEKVNCPLCDEHKEPVVLSKTLNLAIPLRRDADVAKVA
jgi:orotate phosphoribosyltransferase